MTRAADEQHQASRRCRPWPGSPAATKQQCGCEAETFVACHHGSPPQGNEKPAPQPPSARGPSTISQARPATCGPAIGVEDVAVLQRPGIKHPPCSRPEKRPSPETPARAANGPNRGKMGKSRPPSRSATADLSDRHPARRCARRTSGPFQRENAGPTPETSAG